MNTQTFMPEITKEPHVRECSFAALPEALRQAEADGYRVARMDVERGIYTIHLIPETP